MKNTFYYISVFILGLSFMSCSKSATTPTSGGSVTAMVNGSQFSTSSYTVTIDKVPSIHLTIHANASTGAVNLELYPYVGKGSYPITAANNVFYAANSIYNHIDTGTILVTDAYSTDGNKTIINGNFNFTADNNTVVTNGVFNIALELN